MTADRPFYIYMHTSPSGKRYIGQTSLNLSRRWSDGRGYINCTYIHRAIEKYGWDNFRHDIICVVHSKKVANLFEQHYIEKYQTYDAAHGYNLTKGGEGVLGSTWSKERKREHSKRMRGKGNVMYGRHHSDESRRKISENRRGKYIPPEVVAEKTRILLEAVERQKKPVRQYDLEGNYIRSFASAADAGRSLGKPGSSITMCCRGQHFEAYGYKWSYEDEELREKAEKVRKERKPTGTPVIQCDLDGNELARFNSMNAASRETGISRNGITECCYGSVDSYGGYVWSFAGDKAPDVHKTPVIQYDTDGNEVARFDSIPEASAATGVPIRGIRACCRGTYKVVGGFHWEYSDHCDKGRKLGVKVCVMQLDLNGNEVAKFDSLTEAARETGCDRHRIVECCQGSRESYRDFKWRYADAA